MPKRRENPAFASTPCTTRSIGGTFWNMPTTAAEAISAHSGLMHRSGSCSIGSSRLPTRSENCEEWGTGGILLLRIMRRTFPSRPLWPEGKFMNKITIPDRQPKQADSPSTPASQWLTGFGEYLLNIQGLTSSTHRDYCAVVSRFLDGFCGRAAPDWSLLRGEYLTSFDRGEASRLKRHARETPAVAIRALLRYLRLIGAVRPGLEAAVPRPRDGGMRNYLRLCQLWKLRMSLLVSQLTLGRPTQSCDSIVTSVYL